MKAIVFDWDLALWNSWDIHVWLMGQTAVALGSPVPPVEAIARKFHRPFYEHLTWFFGKDLRRTLDIYMALYRAAVSEKGHLFAGVADVLQTLNERGYRVGVFSDKRHAFGISELTQAGIGHLIDQSLFFLDGRQYKPDPAGLLQVLKAMEVGPEDALYVGDSHQDERQPR